jgi:uncharacterized protein (TIGR02147 family)
MAQHAIDVFRYLDCRLFLADFYRAGKGRGFSYRRFSRAARLRSPNYLKLVIEGQRNLTPEMAERFASACRLKGDAAEYFVELVRFNQAASDAERNQAYRRLSSFQRYRQAQRLELAHAAYHANWYVPAIRELVGSPGFREDAEWIGRRLLPPISARRAAQALESLLTLGLIERKESGELAQRAAVVSTGAQTAHMHIGNFHRAMLRRAAKAIETVPAARRDISSLTLRVRESSIPQLKTRLARLARRRLPPLHGRRPLPRAPVCHRGHRRHRRPGDLLLNAASARRDAPRARHDPLRLTGLRAGRLVTP